MASETSPTGRIVRSQPNMQSIPVRTEEVAKIRKALVKGSKAKLEKTDGPSA